MSADDVEKPFAFENRHDNPRGIDLTRDDLISLYRKLDKRTKDAAELEIENWRRKEGQTDEEFEGLKAEIRDAYKVHVSIQKPGFGSVSSTEESIFLPENFPEQVIAITFDSGFKYHAISNLNPRNRIKLNLDFGRLPLFDVQRLPSAATPNNSFINTFGQDQDWITATHIEIAEFIENRRSVREWLHKQGVYDALLALVGFPLAFWMLYRIGPVFEEVFSNYSSFLVNALYIYFFFFFLFLFRFFFSYAQWVWPPNVIKGVIDPALRHRLFIGAVVFAVIVDVVTGLVRALA